MIVTKEDIEEYLKKVKESVRRGKYQFACRDKNEELTKKYVIKERDMIEIILDLNVLDFCKVVKNEHPKFGYEKLYIFSKTVRLIPRFFDGEKNVDLYIKFNLLDYGYCIVISFHEQEFKLIKYFEDKR